MTTTITVITEQIPGPPGATGATGATGAAGAPGVDAIVKPVTSASVLAHAAQQDPGVPGSVRAAAVNFETTPFAGVFTASQIAGLTQAIQHHGPIAPADYNLGVGTVSWVGCDVNGAPVRIEDPACVSGRLNYLGWCDVAGTIFVAPMMVPWQRDCTADGADAVALGFDCHAATTGSFAGGYHTTASGLHAFAWGWRDVTGCVASGDGSIAIGIDAMADQSYAVAIGAYTSSRSAGSVAIGELISAGFAGGGDGQNASIIGFSGYARGRYSHSHGSFVYTQQGAQGAFVCGYKGSSERPGARST